MNRRYALKAFAALMVCPLCVSRGFAEEHHWGYEGANGPDKWGSLDAANRMCSTGTQQSPLDITGPIGEFCRGRAAPRVTVCGWHVFETDQLTGNHTLVCDVEADTRAPLVRLQQETIAVTAPLRDRRATRACYGESWARLSEVERENVERFGFPFLGSIWHPHVTVASIRPECWDAVWSELAGRPPGTTVEFPHLSIFGMRGGEPALIERFALEGDE